MADNMAAPADSMPRLPLDGPVWRDALLRMAASDGVAALDMMTRMAELFFPARREDEAIRVIKEVVACRPDDWGLGLVGAIVILRYAPDYALVETLLRNVLRCQPDNIMAQGLLAQARMAGGDVAGGCAQFTTMMQRYPGERAAIGEQMAGSLLQLGYPEESLKVLSSCLEGGRETAESLEIVGCCLGYLNRSADAIPWYERAFRLGGASVELRTAYACMLLKAGRLREGWPLYLDRNLVIGNQEAWYLSLPRLRPNDDIAGRGIILFQDQGLGDTLQFIRFVPELLAKGARVTILVPRPLVRLLAQSYPAACIHDIRDFGRGSGYDYAAPIPDLPYIAKVMSIRDVPAPIPYLRADAGDVARFAALVPPRRPRIGLVWAGERRLLGGQALIDERRSTTLAAMGAALTPVEATLVSLQLGRPREEVAQWTGQALYDPMGAVRDMADTAAVMANLDLVISVDTSPLHLAGAVGCPVWLISRRDACWRWGDAGDRSPWYPDMRIFRARERSLAPVLTEVGAALRIWAEHWRLH